MKELVHTLRLALSVLTLPILVTLVVGNLAAMAQEPTQASDETKASVAKEEIPAPASALIEVSEACNQVLWIDQSGGISGRVGVVGTLVQGTVGAPGLTVSLNRKGSVVAESQTDWSGIFRFENVAPGAYTFIASSPEAIATFGVYVSENADNAPEGGKTQVDVIAVGSNAGAVRTILNKEISAASSTIEQVAPELDQLIIRSGSNRVHRTENGTVDGRVAPLEWNPENDPPFNLTGNDVYLFQGSELIAQKPVQPNGEFSFTDVQPGMYDFVCFGRHGASAMTIEIVDHNSVTLNSLMHPAIALTGLVTARVQEELQTNLSEPPVGPPVEVEVTVEQPTGFFPGGGGGAAGGVGGIGDFGGLIGAALAAWVLVEAIDSRNNQNFIRQPVVVPPIVLPPPTSPN